MTLSDNDSNDYREARAKMDDMSNRFKFHPATDVTGPQHERVRNGCLSLALHWVNDLPEGREKSLAFTKLEEAMMWANAAIARNQ